MLRIAAAAVAIVVLMILVKDGRIMRHAGLIGSCRVVQTGADGSSWAACRPGKLEGRPDLTKKSCVVQSLQGSMQLWRCPAAVAASAIR